MTDKKVPTKKSASVGKTELAAGSDGKTEYFVKLGIAWVNRQRVKGGKVRLSDVEARFDLDHGRISKSAFGDDGQAESGAGSQ